jgi:hypothetical protein
VNLKAGDTTIPSLLEFPAGWSFALGIYLLSAVWLSCTGLKLPSGRWDYAGYFLFLLSIKMSYLGFDGDNIPILRRNCLSFKKFFLGSEYILLCSAIGAGLCVLSYLCCAWDYPLVDYELNQIDQAMGVNWGKLFLWSVHKPANIVLVTVYDSLVFQIIFFAIWFAFLHDKDRLYEIFWILSFSLLAIVIISGFLPALGPASALGLMPLYWHQYIQNISDMDAIRAGVTSTVVIEKLSGIVVFPSFHTASAIIYMYAFRESGVISIVAILINIAMLLSIPVMGDHYITDMLAGAVVAIMTITVTRIFAQKYRVVLSKERLISP